MTQSPKDCLSRDNFMTEYGRKRTRECRLPIEVSACAAQGGERVGICSFWKVERLVGEGRFSASVPFLPQLTKQRHFFRFLFWWKSAAAKLN